MHLFISLPTERHHKVFYWFSVLKSSNTEHFLKNNNSAFTKSRINSWFATSLRKTAIKNNIKWN